MPKRANPPRQPPAKRKVKPGSQPRRRLRRVTHDAFFKKLLKDPKKALAFLRCFLPPRISFLLADRLPVPLDPHHVSGSFKSSQSDLEFRAFLKDGSFTDVNMEHKSAPVQDVHLQLFGYHTAILGRSPKETATALRDDPAVINVLAYHGAADWNPPVTLSGEAASEASAKLDSLTLDDFRRFRVLFIDFKAYAMAQDSPEALRQILPRLRAGSRRHGREVLTYIEHNWNTKFQLLQAVEEEFIQNSGGNEMGRAWDQAVAHGVDLGREEGMAQARADWLLRLLRKEFGDVPSSYQRRVEQASAVEMDFWFDQLASAQSLEAVFGSGP